MSWAEKCQQKKPKNSSKSTLNIQINAQTATPHTNEGVIPKQAGDEKEFDSADDTVFIGNNTVAQPIDNSGSRSIQRNLFVFKSIQNTEQKIIFQLTIPYLSAEDCINFMKSCGKYGKMFRKQSDQDSTALWLWKFLYHRDFGKIKFHKKRRAKITRQQQMEKHRQKLNDYIFWQEQYQLKSAKQFIIRCRNSCLTFYQTEQNGSIRDIHENDMIIVTPHRCKPKDLLTVDNIVNSNWYDIEETESDLYRTHVECRKRWGNFRNYVECRKRIKGSLYGYRNLNIDLMMENIDTTSMDLRGYVHIVRYVELKCYLVEIMDGAEIQKCTLLDADIDDGRGQLMEGVIVNRVLDVGELKFKMLEFAKKRKKLKVLVYGMAFGTLSEHRCERVTKHTLGRNGTCVVVDYYDED